MGLVLASTLPVERAVRIQTLKTGESEVLMDSLARMSNVRPDPGGKRREVQT